MHTFPSSTLIGRNVLYMLNEGDVRQIVQERQNAGRASSRGNDPRDGSVYPGVIVAEFGGTTANLQVFLDGTDSFWPTSRSMFQPDGHGRRVPVVDGERVTEAELARLAGPNDVGAGEAARVTYEFEPDARGHWTTI